MSSHVSKSRPSRVVFIGDFDRGDQAINVRRLHGIIAPVLDHCGVESSCFTSAVNEETDLVKWLPQWKTTLLDPTVHWPQKLSVHDACFVGFEAPPKYLQWLSKEGVRWINISIHPLRFLDDLYFDVRTSFNYDLRQQEAPQGLISQSVRVLKGKYPEPDAGSKSKKLAIVGQTPIDKSICFEGHFYSLLDYLPGIDELAEKHDVVVYKPHPYLSDAEVDATILQRYQAELVKETDTYAWLDATGVSTACAISSSLIHEASYFGVEGVFLDDRANYFGSPISYRHLIDNVEFWACGLLQLPKRAVRPPRISEATPQNFLRHIFGSWGYKCTDEKS